MLAAVYAMFLPLQVVKCHLWGLPPPQVCCDPMPICHVTPSLDMYVCCDPNLGMHASHVAPTVDMYICHVTPSLGMHIM